MATGFCHLDTLGILTHNIQKKEGIFGANVKQTDSISDYYCKARENQDALDLLNSAHSSLRIQGGGLTLTVVDQF